jgi:hypothetical protein
MLLWALIRLSFVPGQKDSIECAGSPRRAIMTLCSTCRARMRWIISAAAAITLARSRGRPRPAVSRSRRNELKQKERDR